MLVNCKCADDVEPCDYVTLGEDGILKIARFGDIVAGQVFRSISRDRNLELHISSFKLEGYWKYRDDKEQFYKDKFTPTGKFRKYCSIQLDDSTVKSLYKDLEKYLGDPKYKLDYDYYENGICITWTEEWKE